jgi:glucan phosphoethanolaminetransferase (alkaline phosphatase superfamily)
MTVEKSEDATSSREPINKKHVWFRLTKTRANVLLFYLLFITLISSASLATILIKETNLFKGLSVFSLSVVSVIISSLIGAGLYYSRKLYKACINQDMLFPQSETDSIRQLGVTFYYISRPIYAACLSLIVCVALRSGAEFISPGGELNEKYPYLVMLIGFFVGYSSSDFIDDLESKGKNIVGGIIKNN